MATDVIVLATKPQEVPAVTAPPVIAVEQPTEEVRPTKEGTSPFSPYLKTFVYFDFSKDIYLITNVFGRVQSP